MPRRRLLFVLAAVAALTGAGGAAPQTAEPVTVTTFVINGRGWGHGVGMSQWGAYGYAKRGLSYDRILAHYYRGTQIQEAPVTRMRVLLLERAKWIDLSSPEPFRVQDGAGVVRDVPAGAYRLDWKLTLKLDPAQPVEPLTGPLTFLPGKSPLSLARPWRGTLTVTVTGKRLSVVNTVTTEAYLRGVVPSEVPRDWPLEAVKAQAVAARSYALSHRRPGEFDVYADTRDQVYAGILAETPTGERAVTETKRQVLVYDGKVASTYYFSTSGGRTAAITDVFANAKPTPYLVSVPDPYDTASPYHTWGPVVVPAATAGKKLKVTGLAGLRPVPGTGRARDIVMVGRDGEETLRASEVRRALGLRSTWFKVGVLALSRPAGTIAGGTSVTLGGRVEQVEGAVLEQRVVGSDWEPGPAIELQPDGSFSVAIAPTATMQYRLVAGEARSAPLRVPVASS